MLWLFAPEPELCSFLGYLQVKRSLLDFQMTEARPSRQAGPGDAGSKAVRGKGEDAVQSQGAADAVVEGVAEDRSQVEAPGPDPEMSVLPGCVSVSPQGGPGHGQADGETSGFRFPSAAHRLRQFDDGDGTVAVG